MSAADILLIAEKTREAIEKADKSLLPSKFQNFPRGCCGDAALILGVKLKENGYGEFKYIEGSRGSHENNNLNSHAWLKGYDLIVDITANQFSEFPHKVFVETESSFHASFDIVGEYSADFREYGGLQAAEMGRIYREIIKSYGRV